MPYFVMFTGLAIFSLYDVLRLELRDKMLRFVGYMVAVLVMVLFAGTAYGLHVDYKMYEDGYSALTSVRDNLDNFNVDLGFKAIVLGFKSVDIGFYLFYLLWIVMIMILVASSIRSYVAYPIIGLFLFFSSSFLPITFQMIRQGFAVSVFLFSLRYIQRGEKATAVFLCLLAGFIHSSAWIAALFLLLADRRGTRMGYAFAAIFLFSFILLRIDTIGRAFHALDGFASRALPFIWGKISYYVNDSLYGEPVKLSLNFLRIALVLGIGIAFYDKLASGSKYFVIVFNLFFINYFFMTFFNSIVVLYGRMSFYFQLDYLLLPMYLNIIKGRDRLWPWLAIVLYAFGAIATFLHPSNSGWELAYQSWLLQ